MEIFSFLKICKLKQVEAVIRISHEIVMIELYMKRGLVQDHETIALPFLNAEMSSQVKGALENKIEKTLKSLEEKLCNHIRINEKILIPNLLKGGNAR